VVDGNECELWDHMQLCLNSDFATESLRKFHNLTELQFPCLKNKYIIPNFTKELFLLNTHIRNKTLLEWKCL
jgi:hypothetical protein